jgi:Transglycosylase SLT domain
MSIKTFNQHWPDDAIAHLQQVAAKYGVDPGLLYGVIQAETGHIEKWSDRIKAESPKGARGLAQFMPQTARQYGIDPHDPFQAIDGAGRYLRDGMQMLGDNPSVLAAAYNAGPYNSAVQRGQIPKIKETQGYVSKVAMNRMAYLANHTDANKPVVGGPGYVSPGYTEYASKEYDSGRIPQPESQAPFQSQFDWRKAAGDLFMGRQPTGMPMPYMPQLAGMATGVGPQGQQSMPTMTQGQSSANQGPMGIPTRGQMAADVSPQGRGAPVGQQATGDQKSAEDWLRKAMELNKSGQKPPGYGDMHWVGQGYAGLHNPGYEDLSGAANPQLFGMLQLLRGLGGGQQEKQQIDLEPFSVQSIMAKIFGMGGQR